ncbi:MAG: response regulator transcription factor [Pseudomonadota bacterium]
MNRQPAHGQNGAPTPACTGLGSDERGSLSEAFQSLLLVEDHPLFREGLHRALCRLLPEAKVKIASTGLDARQHLLNQAFDLVFLDLHLPEISGFAILEELQTRGITQPIVIITGVADSMIVQRARTLGVLGVVSKRIDNRRLTDLCLRLMRGETLFELERHWLEALRVADGSGLTRRELDVLLKLAEGLENGPICEQLGMSHSTLRTHLTSLFIKLQVGNRTACVVKAMRMGWI